MASDLGTVLRLVPGEGRHALDVDERAELERLRAENLRLRLALRAVRQLASDSLDGRFPLE